MKLVSYGLHIAHILVFLSLGHLLHIGVEWYFYGETILKIIIGGVISLFGLGTMIYLYRKGLQRIQELWETVEEDFSDNGERESLPHFIYTRSIKMKNIAIGEIEGLGFRLFLLLVILKLSQHVESYLLLNPVEQFIQAFISLIYLIILIMIVLPYTK